MPMLLRYPDTAAKLVVMDAPVPGIPPWDDIVRTPLLWHFSFGGPRPTLAPAGSRGVELVLRPAQAHAEP